MSCLCTKSHKRLNFQLDSLMFAKHFCCKLRGHCCIVNYSSMRAAFSCDRNHVLPSASYGRSTFNWIICNWWNDGSKISIYQYQRYKSKDTVILVQNHLIDSLIHVWYHIIVFPRLKHTIRYNPGEHCHRYWSIEGHRRDSAHRKLPELVIQSLCVFSICGGLLPFTI